MMEERAKFYSKTDLANGIHLMRAEKVLVSFDDSKPCACLEDVIELYNVKLLLDNGLALKTWTKETIQDYHSITKKFGKHIVSYLRSINHDEIVKQYLALPYGYKEDFWVVLESFGQIAIVDETILTEVLSQSPDEIEHILRVEKLVKQFDAYITTYLRNYIAVGKLLVNEYLTIHDNDYKKIVFPSGLNLEERDILVYRYVESDSAEFSTVSLIHVAKDTDFLKLDPKTRLRAKKRIAELQKKYEDEGKVSYFPTSISIEFSQDKNIPVVSGGFNDWNISFRYSEEYVKQCNDAQLFRNFVSIFGYLDDKSRVTMVNNRREDHFLEKIQLTEHRFIYPINDCFRRKNNIGLCQLFTYDACLKRIGKGRIEELIQHFYSNILKDEYGYPAPILSMSAENDTFSNKNKVIAPEMEAVVKQYNLFVKEGDIDLELLDMSMPLPITLAKSLVKKKCAYIPSKDCEIFYPMYLMFSDQSRFLLLDKKDDKKIYSSVYEILNDKGSIYEQQIQDFQKEDLKYLVDNGYLKQENGEITILDKPLLHVLYDLYRYWELPYWYYETEERKKIEDLVAKGWLTFDDYLLSPEERHYFNYYLNNVEFSNGPDIRNKYAHGTRSALVSESEHQQAYGMFVMLFIIILLKIDEDLNLNRYLKSNGIS